MTGPLFVRIGGQHYRRIPTPPDPGSFVVEVAPVRAIGCPACHGDGTITVNPGHPDPQAAIDVRCPKCRGTGEAPR